MPKEASACARSSFGEAGRAVSVGARGVTLLSKPVGGYDVSEIAVLVSALSHACDPAENSWSLPPSAALMKRSAHDTRTARLKCIGAAPHLRGYGRARRTYPGQLRQHRNEEDANDRHGVRDLGDAAAT